MKNRMFAGIMVMSAVLVSSAAVYAEPAGIPTPTHAAMANSKLVKFTVRNDSKSPITVKMGDTEMTFAPGKSTDVKLAVGTQLVAQNAGSGFEAGSVLAVVSTTLNSATLVLK